MTESNKKTFCVGCAVVIKDKKILIAQRPQGTHLAGYWEFPGGKCEENESLDDCLRRELLEELGIRVEPRREITSMVHEYPERILDLHFILCDWKSGEAQKFECADFRWIEPQELPGFVFPKADASVIDYLIKNSASYLG